MFENKSANRSLTPCPSSSPASPRSIGSSAKDTDIADSFITEAQNLPQPTPAPPTNATTGAPTAETHTVVAGYEYVGEGLCKGGSGISTYIYPRIYITSRPDKKACGDFCDRFRPAGEQFRGFEWTGLRKGGECWCYFDAGSDTYGIKTSYANAARAETLSVWGNNYKAKGPIASVKQKANYHCYKVVVAEGDVGAGDDAAKMEDATPDEDASSATDTSEALSLKFKFSATLLLGAAAILMQI